MASIRFAGFGEARADVGDSILDAAAEAGIPVGSACGGVCACSTCHVYVTQGGDLLSPQDDDEADVLDKAFDVRASSRLSCRARVVADGSISVEITRESVETYENEHPAERGRFTGRPATSPARCAQREVPKAS
jgi:ferredoxin